MPAPLPPDLSYSYTDFQLGQGDNGFPGSQLDADLQDIKQSLVETINQLNMVIRSDGKLNNGIVTKTSLSPDILIGLDTPTVWAPGTLYNVDAVVSVGPSLYVALSTHLSAATFAEDLTAGRWQFAVEFQVDVGIVDGGVTTPKLADAAVTTPKIADANVTTAKLQDAAVTLAKLEVALQSRFVPIGAEFDWAGIRPPPGYLFMFGQAVDRTVYAALFNALCPVTTGNITNTSNTITGVAFNHVHSGVVGVLVEGSGIPLGTHILAVAANGDITMSAAATATTVGASIRVMAVSQGDGVTTFNLPDARDFTHVGRGNMGGAAIARIDQTILPSNKLGYTGGDDTHQLTEAQMALHTHTAIISTVPDHTHAFTALVSAAGHPTGTDAGSEARGQVSASTTAGAGGHNHTIAINGAGGGVPHPNVQPSRVVNRILFTGVIV